MNAQTSLSDRLEKCYSGAVYDVLRAMGLPDQTLPYTIHPINPEIKLAGPVYTVNGRFNEKLDPHERLPIWNMENFRMFTEV